MQRALLPGTWSKSRFAFGGSLLKGSHPKTKRIFNPKLPLHVVLKSSKARGARSLLNHSREIASILSTQATRHHIRLHQVANAGNHLHLVIEAPSRTHLSAFLKAISGRIAQTVLNTKRQPLHRHSKTQTPLASGSDTRSPHRPDTTFAKGTPTPHDTARTHGFWDARPFSRILSRGRDLQNVLRYLGINSTEMAGLTRSKVRTIFTEVENALRRGLIPRSPGLVAAGFS